MIKTKRIKLKNRRVDVGRQDKDGSVFIAFTRLNDAADGQYVYSEIKGKKVETKLAISPAAAVSLFFLLRAEITIEDLKEFEQETGQKVCVE